MHEYNTFPSPESDISDETSSKTTTLLDELDELDDLVDSDDDIKDELSVDDKAVDTTTQQTLESLPLPPPGISEQTSKGGRPCKYPGWTDDEVALQILGRSFESNERIIIPLDAASLPAMRGYSAENTSAYRQLSKHNNKTSPFEKHQGLYSNKIWQEVLSLTGVIYYKQWTNSRTKTRCIECTPDAFQQTLELLPTPLPGISEQTIEYRERVQRYYSERNERDFPVQDTIDLEKYGLTTGCRGKGGTEQQIKRSFCRRDGRSYGGWEMQSAEKHRENALRIAKIEGLSVLSIDHVARNLQTAFLDGARRVRMSEVLLSCGICLSPMTKDYAGEMRRRVAEKFDLPLAVVKFCCNASQNGGIGTAPSSKEQEWYDNNVWSNEMFCRLMRQLRGMIIDELWNGSVDAYKRPTPALKDVHPVHVNQIIHRWFCSYERKANDDIIAIASRHGALAKTRHDSVTLWVDPARYDDMVADLNANLKVCTKVEFEQHTSVDPVDVLNNWVINESFAV